MSNATGVNCMVDIAVKSVHETNYSRKFPHRFRKNLLLPRSLSTLAMVQRRHDTMVFASAVCFVRLSCHLQTTGKTCHPPLNVSSDSSNAVPTTHSATCLQQCTFWSASEHHLLQDDERTNKFSKSSSNPNLEWHSRQSNSATTVKVNTCARKQRRLLPNP